MADSRVHGPERCPGAPAGCEACSGFHHWLEDSVDPDDFESADEHEQAVLDYDAEHGTEHALGYYGCKHCPAWAEAEYVWELEEDD